MFKLKRPGGTLLPRKAEGKIQICDTAPSPGRYLLSVQTTPIEYAVTLMLSALESKGRPSQ